MRFISHRGNVSGKIETEENRPSQISAVLDRGYDCEIDLWFTKGTLFLGHDNPQFAIDSDFLRGNNTKLWIHCKNIAAIVWCTESNIDGLNFFWHEKDTVTLTSLGFIWAYPGFQPIESSVAVMPEINGESNLEICLGICSDNIEFYKEQYEKI